MATGVHAPPTKVSASAENEPEIVEPTATQEPALGHDTPSSPENAVDETPGSVCTL